MRRPHQPQHPSLSRRSFLKLGGLAFGAGLFRPDLFKVSPPRPGEGELLALGRVPVPAVYVYAAPSFKTERVETLTRDTLVSLLEEYRSPAGPEHNPLWYRIASGWLHSGRLQRIDLRPENTPLERIPEGGIYAEVTVPYERAYRFLGGGRWQRLYRLYYSSVHWVIGLDEGPDGGPWYRLRDTCMGLDYHFPARCLRPIAYEEYSPFPGRANPDEKRIRISIGEQSLAAYEGEEVVFRAKVSSGVKDSPFFNNNGIPTDTPLGNFHIQFKTVSRHMGDGNLTDDINAYELPGVPWTMVFQKDGVALHGTYWHANYGARMSHGCVNLRNEDALWLFRWADPVFTGEAWYARGMGTLVQVVE